jgi:hypothetical protein
MERAASLLVRAVFTNKRGHEVRRLGGSRLPVPASYSSGATCISLEHPQSNYRSDYVLNSFE